MAPPARAMPPPMKAPASSTDPSAAIELLSLIGGAVSGASVYLWCEPTGWSGRWNGGPLGGRGLVAADGVVEVLVTLVVRDLVVMVLLVVLVAVARAGHREVEDGQQGEDERLDD